MTATITSRDNERVKHANKLAASSSFRREEGLLFAEGKRLCFDLAETLVPRTVFATEAFLHTCPEAEGLAPDSFVVSGQVAQKLADTKTPQGLFCVFERPVFGPEALRAPCCVVCCGLQDPANVGAILRSAAAFGFGAAALVDAADPYSPKALRASMGAAGRLPIVTDLPLAGVVSALRANRATLYAADARGAKPAGQVKPQKPLALLVGAEGAGLPPEALEAADEAVTIPMRGDVESLNAAVAASVLMLHFGEVDLS